MYNRIGSGVPGGPAYRGQICCPTLTCPPAVQLCGTMAKGMAAATLDGEYLARFRSRPLTHRARLMAGVQAAAVGVYEGVVGAPHQGSTQRYSEMRNLYRKLKAE